MTYRFQATRTFWRAHGKLTAHQQQSTRAAFLLFRRDPFHPRLRPHKIQKLSARYGRVIYAVEIEANLRAVFYTDGDLIVTLDIGSHEIYRG